MKILIIGPSWVGDAVISQSLLKVIHSKRSEAKIDVLSPEWTTRVFARMDEVSEIITLPFTHGQIKLKQRSVFGKTLISRHYDQIIVLPNSLKSALIPYFSKAPIRTGWRGEMRYFLINDLRVLDKTAFPRMVDRFVALALEKDSGLPSEIPLPSLRIEQENLTQLRKKHFIRMDTPIICLCPGAEFGPAKRWPARNFAQVAKTYLKKEWQVVLLGSKNDVAVGEEITESVNKNLDFFNLIGKTKLEDTIDLLASSQLVLTNDSGLMHIAASVQVPLLALYGPTSPDFTPPLSSKAKIIRKAEGYTKIRKGGLEGGYDQSLIDIKPPEVMETLLESEP